MNKCDICEAEWDPQNQSHRRGQDCASRLKEFIDRHYVVVLKLKEVLQSFLDEKQQKDDATVHAFEDQRSQIQNVIDRVDRIAKRVNLLEHPELKRVRSMPKPGED